MIKIFVTTLLGGLAITSAGLWLAAYLFSDAKICFGDGHRAMGCWIWDFDENNNHFIKVFWGSATQQGFEIYVHKKGIGIERSAGWKPMCRTGDIPEWYPLYQDPDLVKNWGRPDFVHYLLWHSHDDGMREEEMWHSELYLRHWVLSSVTWMLFGSLMVFLFLHGTVEKKRRLLCGFPVGKENAKGRNEAGTRN